MKTLIFLAIVALSTTAVAREDRVLFDLSLKGIVVESNLAQSPTSEQSLKSGIVVEDVLLQPTNRCQTAPLPGTDPRLASADCR